MAALPSKRSQECEAKVRARRSSFILQPLRIGIKKKVAGIFLRGVTVSLSGCWELPAEAQLCNNKASGRTPGALLGRLRHPPLSYLLIATISRYGNVWQPTSAEHKAATLISDRLFTAAGLLKRFPSARTNPLFFFFLSTFLTVPKWMINFFTYALFLQGLELFMHAARCEAPFPQELTSNRRRPTPQ